MNKLIEQFTLLNSNEQIYLLNILNSNFVLLEKVYNKTILKLDKKWVDYLLSLSESGSGYQIINVILNNGNIIEGTVVFNAEYLELPDKYKTITNKEIKSIQLY